MVMEQPKLVLGRTLSTRSKLGHNHVFVIFFGSVARSGFCRNTNLVTGVAQLVASVWRASTGASFSRACCFVPVWNSSQVRVMSGRLVLRVGTRCVNREFVVIFVLASLCV